MSIQIRIFDGATPMLDQIALISRHAALATLDQASMELRDQTRAAFRASQGSKWRVLIVNGKRVWGATNGVGTFGKRFNFKKAGPNSMENMINSFVMKDSMTAIIGGMNKSFYPRMYKQEADQGITTPIMGGKRVEGVLGGSWEILNKLNHGGSFDSQSARYKRTRMGDDTKPIGKDGNPTYKARNFIERGRNAAMGKVTDIMTSKLESLIYKQVNRATVRAETRVS